MPRAGKPTLDTKVNVLPVIFTEQQKKGGGGKLDAAKQRVGERAHAQTQHKDARGKEQTSMRTIKKKNVSLPQLKFLLNVQ